MASGVVALGIGLLLVLVLAIGSSAPAPGTGRVVVIGQTASGFVVGMFVALLAVGAWAWVLRIRAGATLPAGDRRRPRWPWWLRSLVGVVTLCCILAVVSWIVGPNPRPASPQDRGGPQGLGNLGSAADAPRQGIGGPAFSAGVALALLVAAGFLATNRGRATTDDDEDDDDEGGVDAPDQIEVERRPFMRALDASLDDLEREPDPRRAVIAAYRRVQPVLASVGVARRASETEPELLARAVQRLGAEAAPLRELTDLYERARYSVHDIDESMRRAAIGAVSSLRDGLLEARR